MQKLSDATGLRITVCHFPPGTSKWNKIEHRLFSFISINWRGKPLISHEVITSLIASTTGLKVYAQLDERPYPKEVQVTDEELTAVNITRHPFHGEWNEQLSNVVDELVNRQAVTFSSVVVVSSSVTLIPSLNFTSSSTSVMSSWPLNRRQRSCAASRSL